MRTLTLVENGLPQDSAELRRLEAEDQAPRMLLYRDALGSDMLDGAYLRRAPALRAALYRGLPTPVAQVLEAYAVKSRYDAVISWADRLGLPFAGLLKATGVQFPHVAILLWISRPKKARLSRPPLRPFANCAVSSIVSCPSSCRAQRRLLDKIAAPTVDHFT